jgi:hypothetical protein
MTADARTDGEIDHLGGKDERSHNAEQRDAGIVHTTAGLARDDSKRRDRDSVEDSPHGRGQEIVRDVH